MHVGKKITFIPAALCSLLWFAQASAHHSFVAEFTKQAPIDIDGWVTRINWLNPHVHFYMDVKDKKTGKMTHWDIEMGPPYLLERAGWKRHSIKIGDEVRVVGWRARDGRPYGDAYFVTNRATGKKLFASSSAKGVKSSSNAPPH